MNPLRRDRRQARRDRRRRRWRAVGHFLSATIPPVLAGTAAVAAFVAVQVESEQQVIASPDRHAVTPVLSARRTPSLVSLPVAERRLQAALTELMGRVQGNACLTVRVGDREVFADDPDIPIVPASIEKLATATAVLHHVPGDERFHTSVRAAALPADGVVDGNLFIVGAGDPLLMTDDYEQTFRRQPQTRTDFEALADAVVAAGVRVVGGSVVGDESRYDQARDVDAWPARFAGQNVTGPLSALMVNDGFVHADPEPAAPEGETGQEPIPNDAPPPRREAAPDPPAHAASVLTSLLELRGVDVQGPPGSGAAPAGAVEVAGIDSPPVTEVIAQMLRESDNTTAELLLKELGVRAGGAGTTGAGIEVVADTLGELGIAADGVRLLDGSGLAEANQVTCRFVQALLDRAGRDSVLANGLAVAGETGTLAERFEGSTAEGRLRAKTGTLRQVTALAGFVDTPGGASLSFSYIVNLTGGDRVNAPDRQLQRELGEALVRYPDSPPESELGPLPPST
ncbi:MAG: D-alanyl-D-alanine carboxypeptidase/D-alanyl-D-alanine endopeptidase [Acidimicrobiales bacterium]